MNWIIIIFVIVGMIAGLVTCQQLGKEEMVVFPHEVFKLLKLFKKEKKPRYLILFIVDILDGIAILLYFFK